MTASALFPRSGRLEGLLQRTSPHCDARPAGVVVSLLVLHYISLPAGVFEGECVDRLFTGTWREGDPEEVRDLRVSAHFFIRRNGEIRQYVSIDDRAWHAGLSNFRGHNACNDFSVGVEIEGTGEVPFEDAQYAALGRLIDRLAELLPLRFVTGHEVIAPGRKQDPGPFFDWDRVERMLPAGLARATAPEDCDRAALEARMRELAAAAGR